MEHCPIGVAILAQKDGRRLFVNSALVKILGGESHEQVLQGDIASTWVDPSRLEEAWSVFKSKKNLVNFEAQRKRFDGSIWWVLMNTQPLLFEGVRAGIVWHIDISARKNAEQALEKSERQMKEAFESLSDAFALFDPDDRLIFSNRMFKELNPDLAPNILLGMTFEEMVRDNIKNGRIIEAIGREEAFVRERMAKHRNPGEPVLSRRADGRWLLLRESRSPDGSTFLVNTDMTDLKLREEALLKEKEKFEQASGYKSQFLATMSHELRTPLNAVLAFSEILQKELFGPLGDNRYQEYATDIHASGQHLLDLINDLLDLARIEAGRYELNFEEADFGELVRSSCNVLKEQAKEKDIRYRSWIAKDLPLIDADSRAVRQILLNLLSNAIKFTPAGGAVSVRAKLDEHGGVTMTVSDTGVGIAGSDLETILTPFSQVASNVCSNDAGAGLGLSIVNALVDLHGGTLDIESNVGEGTQITVTLPISR